MKGQTRTKPAPITLIVTWDLIKNLIEHISKMMTVGTITTKLRKLHIDRIEFGIFVIETNSVTNSFDHLIHSERSEGQTNVLDLLQGGKRSIHCVNRLPEFLRKSTTFFSFFVLDIGGICGILADPRNSGEYFRECC